MEGFSIVHLAPAAGWYIEDRNGERCPVVVFALIEETDKDDTVRRTVEPLVATHDLIELPSFPFVLKHESEFVQ